MSATERADFRVMGSDASVVVCGSPAVLPVLVGVARERLEELEHRWSRFLPTSEISRLNDAAGDPVEVSWETLHLVERALEAWRITGGAYDPTILGDVLRAGYTVSFESLNTTAPGSALAGITLTIGAGSIRLDAEAGTVQLPTGVGFDPGGIGKGLAADMVVEELLAAGATGACVNVGGDLRVAGRGPAADPADPSPDAGWVIAVDEPIGEGTAALLGIGTGGVVTTSRLRRRWTRPSGQPSHHLIDPRSGRPAASGLAAITVIADEAWRAEILAKAAFLAGPLGGAELLDEAGAAGLLFDDDGSRIRTTNLSHFLIPSLQEA